MYPSKSMKYEYMEDDIGDELKSCEQSSNDNMEEEEDGSINLLEIFSFVPLSSRIVLNRLDQLLVRCLLCKEINIQRSNFEDHEQICMKKIVKCQSVDMKCTWKGTRDKLDKHLKICTFQKIRPILDKFQGKISKIETKQIQMERLIKKLEKQMAFIHAFINEGIPMNKNCTISSNKCQYKSIDQWNSIKVFSCQMSGKIRECNQISVHECNGGAICDLCFNEQYSMNETKTHSEYSNSRKEDFSPISTLHSS